MAVKTIVWYGSGIRASSPSNCAGDTKGFVVRLPRRSAGKRTASAGFFTSSPYLTAEAKMLESTSRILSFDSCANSEAASDEKYRWAERAVRSRKQSFPNAGVR